jgi:hypothetical protein
LPGWYHRWRVAATRLVLAASRSDDAQVRWWQARINAALSSGYSEGA